jgi:hypothetical protein
MILSYAQRRKVNMGSMLFVIRHRAVCLDCVDLVKLRCVAR